MHLNAIAIIQLGTYVLQWTTIGKVRRSYHVNKIHPGCYIRLSFYMYDDHNEIFKIQ